MSKFDPQFEKRRKAEKEKQAAEEQAAEQAALKNQAPPAPAADANATDEKAAPPADGSGKETQPAPDAKATTTTEPVTGPPTKDAASPAKDAAVSADAPATKKDEAAPAAAPAKSPATSPSIKPPAPPTKGWFLTDPARRGERPLRLTPEEEKKKEDERQKLARRNEELELRKAIKNQNYFELSEFAGSKNPEAERKRMIVEMYVLFHERGKSLPGDEKEREIRRIDMAFKRFKGRGAQSVDAFFEEMQKEVKAQEEAEAFDVELYTHASRSYVISKFEPGRSGEFGWKQFSEAAKKHPSYNPADEGKLFPMWEAIVKDTDRRIAPFAAQAGRIWEGIKQDNAASVAASVYREIAPKDRAALMDALGMLARALPQDEQATLLGNLMKQAERDIGTLLGNIASMPASGKDLYGLGDFIGYPGSEKTTSRYLRAEWETKRQELLIARNFQIDIQRIGYEIYDPMKSAFGEGPPGILESAFYSMPGALASTAVALVPYAGPLAIYSTMEASSYDSMRRQLIASGMSDEDATRYAATWAPYLALPQVGLERLQAGAILGKLPFLEKAFTKFGDKIASDVIRGALRTGAGAVQETGIEITQDYLPHLLQDTAAALSEDVPDVVWRNGKDGVLDGFWAQSATTFITMLPLAVLGAAGGINADQRVKAFSNASDSTLLALGGSPEAIAALRAAQAQGHASTDAAINNLMSTLNPNSVSARQAVAQLEVEQQEGVHAELSSGGSADAANGDTPPAGDPAAATRIAAERADLTLEDDAATIANITAAYQRAENAEGQGDITASPVSKQAESTEAKTEGITSPKEQATETVEAAPDTSPGNQTDTLPDATLDSLSEAISQDHPEINVRDGAQGLLDAPWARNATVMPELLPIAMEGAGSSFSNEQRISTFRDASDAQLLALGVSPGDLTSIRTALNGKPEDGVQAINEAFSRLDPNSAIAHEALQNVRADHQNRYETGQKPYRLTALSDGRFRVENEKGKVLAMAPDYNAMVRIRRFLSTKKPNAHGHKQVDYSSIPDPRNLLTTGKPTDRQIREMHRLNLEHNNQVFRDDQSGEPLILAEKSKKDVTPSPLEIQIDHIIPEDLGGTRTSANLQILGRANNRRKSNRLPNEHF